MRLGLNFHTKTALAAIIIAVVASVIVVLLITSSGGDDGGNGVTDEQLRAAMRNTVLQEAEVPDGLQTVGGSFTTNEEAASGIGVGPSKEQFDEWGRLLGFRIDFQRTQPVNADVVSALSSSISVYKDDVGAAQSFEQRLSQARTADWAGSHSDLTEFQQLEMTNQLPADDHLWLRFTGFKEVAPGQTVMVADDVLVFRVGRTWGFLNTVSTSASGGTDRALNQETVDALARRQIQHMKDALENGALG